MAKTTKAKTKIGNGANGDAQVTTAQRLATILKSARDIMRKDKGLSGDVDRIPVLTWIMFLKFLDDMELMRQEEAKLSGKKFKAAIEPPYRWRDWAAKEEGITGDELIAFINQEECRRPDGTKGPGLFAYLRGLRGAECVARSWRSLETVHRDHSNRRIAIGAKRRLDDVHLVLGLSSLSFRREGPFSTMRWALCRSRSQIASA